MEQLYTKYQGRGSLQWREMMSRDIRRFNAYQQGRYDLVARHFGDVRGKKILDLGGGDAALAYQLYKRGAEVVVIDNEPSGIEFGKKNFASVGATGEFVVGSAYELPFGNEIFDGVVCSEVIEHLERPEAAIAEAARVLKPGGMCIVTTPHRLTEVPTDSDDLRAYFPSEMHSLMQPYFEKVAIHLTHHIFWYGLYTYCARRFSNRQFGRWFVNVLTLWFGYNPFTFEYPRPAKFDRFAQIIAVGRK